MGVVLPRLAERLLLGFKDTQLRLPGQWWKQWEESDSASLFPEGAP